MSKLINGKTKYQDLEGGFWSIITDDGLSLRPVNMPPQLMEEDEHVECRVEFIDDSFGFQMWGQPVKIISFSTIGSN